MNDDVYECDWSKASQSQLNDAFHVRTDNLQIDSRRRVQILSINAESINNQIPADKKIKGLFLEMALRPDRKSGESDFNPILRVYLKGSHPRDYLSIRLRATTLAANPISLLSERIVSLIERGQLCEKWRCDPFGDLYKNFFKRQNVGNKRVKGYYISSYSNLITFNMLIKKGRIEPGILDVFLGIKPKVLIPFYPFSFAPTFILRSYSEIGIIEILLQSIFLGGVEYIHPCPNTCPPD